MLKSTASRLLLFLCLFIFQFSVSAQTMTFNSGPSHPGFSFSGWTGAGGIIYPSQPNANGVATITKNSLCWNLVSFKTIKFGTGGGYRITSNKGHSYLYYPNAQASKVHTLNWQEIKWVKVILEDLTTNGVNFTYDFDDVVYTPIAKTAASAPTVTASHSAVCPGGSTSVTLNISGNLNDATEWKIYTSSCGSGLVGSTSGTTLTVTPSANTTYYVRGEGDICTPAGGCGTTDITLLINSTPITSVTTSPNSSCPGDAVSLLASGGVSGTGAVVKWYTAPSGGGASFATGLGPHTVNPTQNTTYYVRREGTCNTTFDAMITVTLDVCDPCAALGGDSDGDGVCDNIDICIGGDDNVDDDGDGVPNFCDACPGGNDNADSDGDGVADFCDACPTDPEKITAGQCGCGVADTDSDNDGTADCIDNCINTPNASQLDTDGDGQGDVCDLDDDNDGCLDTDDPNPLVASVDTDGDGLADVCDNDDDNDGISDVDELACGSDPINGSSTCEVCDGVDNDLNDGIDEGFTNTDGDSQADCVDPDDDNDGQLDVDELACGSDPLDGASTSPDNDGDNSPDCVDPDDDNDGILDGDDNCQFNVNPSQEDLDQDNIGDVCDPIVNVEGAVSTLEDLILTLSIKHGLENAFIVKINNAVNACSTGNPQEALGLLNAFINQVEAKRGKDLSDAEADELINIAQIIIDSILSGETDCGSSALKISNQFEDILTDELKISVFPNPSSFETSISFNLNKTQNVSLQLIDLSGQKVKQIEAREFNKGAQQIKFQTKDLDNGIYFIVITTSNSIYSKKISIVK